MCKPFPVTLYNRRHVLSNLGNILWAKTCWSHNRCQYEAMDSCTCIGMYSRAPCTWPHSCMGWGHILACSPWLSPVSGHSCMSRCPRSPQSQSAHGNNQWGLDILGWIPGVPWKKNTDLQSTKLQFWWFMCYLPVLQQIRKKLPTCSSTVCLLTMVITSHIIKWPQ